MSALPVELTIDDVQEISILLDPHLIDVVMRTVTNLPPGTPIVLQGRTSDEPATVRAVSVLRVVDANTTRRPNTSIALVQSLSAAERRVLQYLRTHLTLAEIASRLYVSRNTVKSQAISTYRKLGVCSRSEAVQIAIEADLALNDVPTLVR